MKKKSFNISYVLVLGSISCLMGCASIPSTKTASITETLQPTVTRLILTRQSSKTIEATTTQTLGLVPSTHLTPTPATITTPVITPTLNAEARSHLIQEFLKTNLNCKLPCWWGIEPGKTTWEETSRFLESIGARSSSEVLSDGRVRHDTGGFDFADQNVYNRIGFIERSDFIEGVNIESFGELNPAGFQNAWEKYSPQRILADYGTPSGVWVRASYTYGSSDKTSYGLWLAYQEDGFIIFYSGAVQRNEILHICPYFGKDQDMSRLLLFLQSIDNPAPVSRFVIQDELERPYVKTLQEATQLSIEEFYSLFLASGDESCFDTPGSIWP